MEPTHPSQRSPEPIPLPVPNGPARPAPAAERVASVMRHPSSATLRRGVERAERRTPTDDGPSAPGAGQLAELLRRATRVLGGDAGRRSRPAIERLTEAALAPYEMAAGLAVTSPRVRRRRRQRARRSRR